MYPAGVWGISRPQERNKGGSLILNLTLLGRTRMILGAFWTPLDFQAAIQITVFPENLHKSSPNGVRVGVPKKDRVFDEQPMSKWERLKGENGALAPYLLQNMRICQI